MLALLLWLILPVSGVAGVELDPSDPQGRNDQLVRQCLSYTGSCNIFYVRGRHNVYKSIAIPLGVANVYTEGSMLVPCSKMEYLFAVPNAIPEQLPKFHDLDRSIDATQPCGTFKPPLFLTIRWP